MRKASVWSSNSRSKLRLSLGLRERQSPNKGKQFTISARSNQCPAVSKKSKHKHRHMNNTPQNQNQKRKAESIAHKAFSHYLATRRAYCKGQATIQQVAHTLAVFDLTLAIAHLKRLPQARSASISDDKSSRSSSCLDGTLQGSDVVALQRTD